MIKKPEDQNFSVYMVVTDQIYFPSCILLVSPKVLNMDIIPSYYQHQQQSISLGHLEEQFSQQEGKNQAPE